jgi:hypothetical protein
MGGPLADAIKPGYPLPWADARYLLDQLVEEFRAAELDGTLPARLALDHIWVEPNGRVQVLDFPLCDARYRHNSPLLVLREAASLVIEGYPRATSGSVSAPLPAHAMPVLNRLFNEELPLPEFQKELAETQAHRPEVTPAIRAAHVGMQAAGLALPLALLLFVTFMLSVGFTLVADIQKEYAQQAAMILAEPGEREKLTSRAPRDRELEAALANPRLQVRVNDLAIRTRQESDMRREALLLPQRQLFDETAHAARLNLERDPRSYDAVREILLWAGERGHVGRTESPWESGYTSIFVGFALVPLAVMLLASVLLASVFRGSPTMLLAGIAIVRADGRRAFRSQCALRSLLVWFPVFAILLGSCLLQTYAPRLVYLAVGLWLFAAALLPVYVVIALRFPSRPPQDRMLGTYLVPM